MGNDGPLDLAHDVVCSPELRFTDLGAQQVRPRSLGLRDPAEDLPAGWRRPKQLGAAVTRVLLVSRQAVGYQKIGHPLNGLSGDTPAAGDPGNRRRTVLDRVKDHPSRERLITHAGQRLPGGRDEATESCHADDEFGEQVARVRTRWTHGGVDIMLSFLYTGHADNMMSY
jgi:hypothetical protein